MKRILRKPRSTLSMVNVLLSSRRGEDEWTCRFPRFRRCMSTIRKSIESPITSFQPYCKTKHCDQQRGQYANDGYRGLCPVTDCHTLHYRSGAAPRMIRGQLAAVP